MKYPVDRLYEHFRRKVKLDIVRYGEGRINKIKDEIIQLSHQLRKVRNR